MESIKNLIDWAVNLSLYKKIGSAIFLITVAVIANIISHQINKSDDLEESKEVNDQSKVHASQTPKAFFQLSNYYIKVKNTTYPDLDTIVLRYSRIGNRNLELNDITLINSHIDDDVNFHSGPEVAPFSISLLDYYVKNDSIFLEISRKMIFDGFHAAWFNEEDKHQIGELTFRIPYNLDNEAQSDTLTSRIYLIK